MPNETSVSSSKTKQNSPKNHRIRYIIYVAFNILFLYVANHLIAWEAQSITDEWLQVLGIINVSIVLNIIIYSIFIFYKGRVFYFISCSIIDIVGLAVFLRLYQIFPFDFNGFFKLGWLNEVVPYFLLLGMAGIIIGLIIRTKRFVTYKKQSTH